MKRDQISILEEIFQIIAESEDPDQTLDRIVRIIARRLSVDACSVYVYDASRNRLVLRATMGLSPNSVGTIEMGINEGLTGMAIETLKPVFVIDPSTHPRFKFYAQSGEEAYQTLLALPLIYHQQILGVMVVQTLSREGISEADIPVFENIATQISATVAYTGLISNGSRRPSAAKPDGLGRTRGCHYRKSCLKGEAVSESVAEGIAHYLPETIDFDQVGCTFAPDSDSEEKRIERAFLKAEEQIRRIAQHAHAISPEEAGMVEAHLMFLTDRSLKNRIRDHIRSGSCAEYALKQVIMSYVEKFRAVEDPYLSERSADILDIGRRVLDMLIGTGGGLHRTFDKDTIVIASDLSPVDLLAIRQPHLKGIVLFRGGRTSHTVILAKSFEITIVIGVDNVIETVREGDHLILDGVSGFVFANPPKEIRVEYDRRREEEKAISRKLESIKNLPAVTTDGVHIGMGANIGLMSDTELVRKSGADHVGLYRTEFPFLLRKSFPTEEDQFAIYQKVLENVEGRSVTIRTFDAGGDKFLPYTDSPREDNPFLGWRSIRISLDLEDVFRTQIRAILRASAFGKAKMLFPMITSVKEIRRITEIVASEKEKLTGEGVDWDARIEAGIMIEVPAAARILDRLLRYIDFVSIGTNDLVQYLLAVDRNNKKVGGLYNALHPSVVETVADIVAICKKNKVPVGVCGEAASRQDCLLLYAGMGVDFVSMAPTSIPAAKQFIRQLNLNEAAAILQEARRMEDSDDISRFLSDYLKQRDLD